MTIIALFFSFGTLSYLLGAVPSGYLIGRAKGVDIRRHGSGNIGATNVFRTVGKTYGAMTFVCDALKGFVPAFVFPILARSGFGYDGGHALSLLCAALAIVGHNWPIYLGFKGGKGVATTAGGLLGIAPLAALIGLALWLVVFVTTRYVSVASIVAAVAVPVAAWPLYAKSGRALPAVLIILGALVVFRHKSNIVRLRQGTEHRFKFGKRKEGTADGRRGTP